MTSFPAHPHLVVATPCYGGLVTSAYTHSLLSLQKTCLEAKIDLSVRLLGGDSLITRARNFAVQQFLAIPTATHLLFIDADIGFTPEQALALLAANKDVCGGIYPLKRLDWQRIRHHAAAGVTDLQASALNYVVDLLDAAGPAAGEDYFRVASLGTGFMMIKRDVFDLMAARYPEIRFRTTHLAANVAGAQTESHAFFDCIIDPESGAYLSEDYTFCKRWTAIGGEIWAYAPSKLTHVGTHAFEGDLQQMLDGLKGAECGDS